MRNVLFIHSSAELYGSDRSLLNLVKNLDRDQFRIFVILPCEGPLVREMEKIGDVRVDIFEAAVLRRKNHSVKGGVQYLRDYRKSIRYIRNYIRANQIDIVETNTAVVFPGAAAAKKEKIASVWHIREIIKSGLENKVISFIMNRYADVIVANSIATGKALNVPQEKVRVVYNGVDNPVLEKKEHSGILVGMAGRINRWKGQKLFTDAAELVHRELPDVKFVIAGDVYAGEEYLKEDLIRYIEGKHLCDTVLLAGLVEDMPSFYSSIDLFVLPSIQPEPFGLVVIEAMEAGIPVVATNHGGPAEIIEDGRSGYLVSYENAAEMADRILTLCRDEELRAKIGGNGKARKEQYFSAAATVRGVRDILLSLPVRGDRR